MICLTAGPTMPTFTEDETITGQTSGKTAVVQTTGWPIKVDTLSGSFTAGEEILGGTSAARAKLDGTTPMNGYVDVSAENVNGSRSSGGVATGAFEYTP